MVLPQEDLISLSFANAGINTFVVGLIINPTSWKLRLLFLFITSSFYALSYYWISPSNPLFAYFTGIALCFSFIRTTDFLCVHGGSRRLKGQKQPTKSLPFWDRVVWSLKYTVSVRWIGWELEPKGAIPPAQKWSSRKHFIIYQVVWTIILYMMLDVALLFLAFRPLVSGDPMKTASYPFLWRYTIILLTPIIAYLGVQIMYNSFSIAFVLLKLSHPDEWPPLFGSIKSAYTIRGFWGRTWHQCFRVVPLNHAQYLTDEVLRLRNCKIKNLLQLLVVFIISGLLHEAGDYAVHRRWSGSSLRYFLIQATGIALEDALMLSRQTGQKGPISNQRKFLGYIWTIGFAFLTASYFVDPALSFSVKSGTIYFSPILGLTRAEWLPDLGATRAGTM